MAEATAGALQIVQTQQNLVGNTIAGGASAVNEQSSDSQIGILEQIREITLQSFRKTSEIASTLANTLLFQKDESRRREDQSSELELEKNKSKVSNKDTIDSEGANKAKKAAGNFDGIMVGLGVLLTKILSPFKGLLNFFTKLIPLAGIFTKLGPLASGLLRLSGVGTILFLLIKYSDEIIKALTPLFTSIASIYEKLKPSIDFIISLIDGGIKIAISAIGSALSAVGAGLEGIVSFVNGLAETLDAATRGDLDGVLQGLKKTFMAPINFLKNLGKIVFDFFAGIIDSLPLPKFIKDKFKNAVEKKETKTGGAGDTSGEAASPEEVGEVIDPSVETTPNITPEEKPKTINMDKPQSVVSTVATMRETGGETTITTGYTEDQKQGDLGTFNKKLTSANDKIKSLEDTFGFPEFEVGNPDFDNTIAEEAKNKPALGKAWRQYSGLIRERDKTKIAIKEIESRAIEEPTTTERKFDRTVTKRTLKEDGDSKTNMSVVNAPVNSSSVVNNSQPTISYVKMNTGVDAYTEKMQNSF
jgi:hypothetical protein